MKMLMGAIFLLVSRISHAEPIQSNSGHLYVAVGPNFSLMGNIRLGFGEVLELGVIQNSGLGVMFLKRTSSPLFLQAGALVSNGGGVSLGGGLESSVSSRFRVRSDITVNASTRYEVGAVVTIGGVIIL